MVPAGPDGTTAQSHAALQEMEETLRKDQTELNRLRELRDKEQSEGDVVELRRKNDVSWARALNTSCC